jgi:hypothetical protein
LGIVDLDHVDEGLQIGLAERNRSGGKVLFAVRRPDPKGLGARCRNKLEWAQVMLDQSLAALARRCLHLPEPIAAADSWFSDSKLMRHVGHQGTLLVQGKSTYVFTLEVAKRSKALI